MAVASVLVSIVRLSLTFTLGITGTPGFRVRPVHVRRDVLKRIWRFGLRIFAARVAEVIYVSFDRVLLGRVMGISWVTPYDVGAKAAGSGAHLPLIIMPVIEPEAARFYAHGEQEKLELLVSRSTRYAALIAMGIGGLLAAAAPHILEVWIGSDSTSQMTAALRMLIFAHFGASLTGPLRSVSRGIGKPGWEARAAIVQAVVNVILSVTLFYVAGFMGILTGTVGAVLIGQGLFAVLAMRGLRLAPGSLLWGAWGRPLIAAALASVMALWLPTVLPLTSSAYTRFELAGTLALLASCFGVVYIGVCLLLRAITMAELGMLFDAARGRSRG
jgi:O-antigen/teichoic acid export membrane protein